MVVSSIVEASSGAKEHIAMMATNNHDGNSISTEKRFCAFLDVPDCREAGARSY